MLGITVLFHDLSFSWWTDGLKFDSEILWYTKELTWLVPRRGCKTSQNRHPSTAVLTVGTRCLCRYAVSGYCKNVAVQFGQTSPSLLCCHILLREKRLCPVVQSYSNHTVIIFYI